MCELNMVKVQCEPSSHIRANPWLGVHYMILMHEVEAKNHPI